MSCIQTCSVSCLRPVQLVNWPEGLAPLLRLKSMSDLYAVNEHAHFLSTFHCTHTWGNRGGSSWLIDGLIDGFKSKLVERRTQDSITSVTPRSNPVKSAGKICEFFGVKNVVLTRCRRAQPPCVFARIRMTTYAHLNIL